MQRRILTASVIIGVGCALACVSLVAALVLGSAEVSFSQAWSVSASHVLGQEAAVPKSVDSIVWDLRLPRSLLALIVGAGLAVSGVAMQTLVRNPLADPYILGISSGAGVGATAVILFGWFGSLPVSALTVGALVGAAAASFAIMAFARTRAGLTPLRLVLGGVVLSAAFSALSSFMVFAGPDPRAAQSVMFWMLGSVAGATWAKLWFPLVAVLLVSTYFVMWSRQLDALATGRETAAAVGVEVPKLRMGLFLAQSVLVGSIVAVAGGIGFVGLVIPHAARILVGASHRLLIPVALTGGALFMLWVDVLARVIGGSQEMPLGVVTGLIGAPLFLYLMAKNSYRYGGME
ncbi:MULTISPECIES: iron ABC transporter permease [unclassified Corynebacterium]|uniref:FecCD family ABC transporter permease n=1 Tax=unclassified Corynebacterium TaxID=2624378 RepID=UPI00211CD4CE|nr:MULTISPECIES: iron ABC transporter permease [unclassified Corynebacterium]MCQ9358938.1 iron ABC transporter permease [Corynebacterium sp. 142RC1]MCQ9365159.1 iron ABC transporter permease [Corynebacterium sp. 70RC1]